MNTATSDVLIDRTVKPTSRAPSRAASSRAMPASMWRSMFSTTTMASSTTKPVATVSAISDRLSRLYPSKYMAPNVPISEIGTATAGNDAGARAAQEEKHHQRHQASPRSPACARRRFSDERMVTVRSETTSTSMSCGIDAVSSGSSACDPVDRVDDVGARLAIEDHSTEGLPLARPWLRMFSTESVNVGELVEPHRRAVAIGDDQALVLRRPWSPGRWCRSDNGGRRARSRLWGCWRWPPPARRARPRGRCCIFEQGVGIELDAHRRQRTAAQRDLADAARPAKVSAPAHSTRHRKAGLASSSRRSAPGSVMGASAGLTLR